MYERSTDYAIECMSNNRMKVDLFAALIYPDKNALISLKKKALNVPELKIV